MLNDLTYRLQRKVAKILMRPRFLGPGPGGPHKVSLVLYFDYEREFGNPLAKESADAGFCGVVDILSRYGIHATWNCVGLISEHYPQTLLKLITLGQELACHTYRHIDITKVGREEIVEDLGRCKKSFANEFGYDIVGLHPPRDRWSMRLPSLLSGLGYRYLIARDNDPLHWHAHYLKLPFDREILCIPSLADDWGYIENDCGADAMLRFWTERLAALQPGSVVAIGFHPWILGVDVVRLQGFASLIETLVANNDIALVTAREILDWYER